ncbi:MAG: hypothetical protein AAF665_00910 [Pseudomonadota bacterium]
MGKEVPADAAHWDSGDWIEWHRTATGVDDRPCAAAAAQDGLARLTALHVNLLRAARSYYTLTRSHLPVYDAIAQVHAAIYCDLPFEGSERNVDATGVEILHIPPHGPSNTVTVDLTKVFQTLIVVRIKDNFTTEARMIPREAMPDASEMTFTLSWPCLPHTI